MFINAGAIFGRAVAAYERARSRGIAEHEMGPMDALESIVFSVVALEGFMNEAAELASHPAPPGSRPTPPAITTFSRLVGQANEGRASLGLKFQLARLSFVGETYELSRLPYQDFALLIELRNALVHYRSQETFQVNEDGVLAFSPARILDRLRSRNVLAEFEGEVTASWLNRISTIAAARWSCGVAESMVQSILDVVPDSYFKELMEMSYRNSFQVPT